MNVRVFERPDGSVVVTEFVESYRVLGESDTEFFDRLTLFTPWVGLPHLDVNANALPNTRADRHKWRRRGQAIVVDPLVPDPVHPRQALIDAIDAAADLPELKREVKKLARGNAR